MTHLVKEFIFGDLRIVIPLERGEVIMGSVFAPSPERVEELTSFLCFFKPVVTDLTQDHDENGNVLFFYCGGRKFQVFYESDGE